MILPEVLYYIRFFFNPTKSSTQFDPSKMKILLSIFAFCLLSFQAMAQSTRPNIVVIVVDDMRFDEWSAGGHTYLKTPNIDRLAAEGTTFDQAYHAIPLCSPNRASILTGQYPSRHGIIDNTSRDQASFMLDLFPKYLQQAGYTTAHIGKWHMGNSSAPRPGYDYWVCMEGQGSSYDPLLFEDGRSYRATGYTTDIFTDKAVEFIDRNASDNFFLYVGHKAIHPESFQRNDGSTDLSVPKEFIPAERHKGLYEGKIFKRSPSHSPTAEADEDKPVIQNAFQIRSTILQEDPRWGSSMDLGVSEASIQRRAEMMLAVDESLGKIVAELKKQGLYENTLIIFTSDNGYFFGEHGFSLERRLPYEESIKSPLIINYPVLGNKKARVAGLVLSIDLSATALDAAGLELPKTIQGKSLLPLITGQQNEIRPSALVEYFSNEQPFPWTAHLDYRVIIKDQFKYIKWLRFDKAELYDLNSDPYEMNNLIGNPAYAETIVLLKTELQKLQIEALGLD